MLRTARVDRSPRTRSSLTFAALALLLCGSTPAHAIRLAEQGEAQLDFHLLLQPQFQFRNVPGAEPARQVDFLLRRTRLVLSGRLTRWLSFFFDTDQPNWGKGGDWSPAFFVQDAVASFELHRAFTLDAGMLLLPFVHNAVQGATTLHTLDYHGDLVRYPTGSHKGWRDVGAQARGLLAADRVQYRLAIGSGRAGTPNDSPRLSGRLTYNFLDPEDGLFLAGTYLGKKRVLSVAAAADFQYQGLGHGASYLAFGGDVFLDLPLPRDQRVSGQLNYVRYEGQQVPPPAAPAERIFQAGQGLLFDLGYAIHAFEPVIAVDWFRPRGQAKLTQQLLALRGGLNWWLLGHDLNLKLELALVKAPGVPIDSSALHLTLQTQLYF